MDTVECMRRFLAVAETGSFSQAASQMAVPKSAVSSSVTKLETRLQTRLFHRSTRQVTLTESGRQYLPECQRILADLDATADRSRPIAEHGIVAVARGVIERQAIACIAFRHIAGNDAPVLDINSVPAVVDCGIAGDGRAVAGADSVVAVVVR